MKACWNNTFSFVIANIKFHRCLTSKSVDSVLIKFINVQSMTPFGLKNLARVNFGFCLILWCGDCPPRKVASSNHCIKSQLKCVNIEQARINDENPAQQWEGPVRGSFAGTRGAQGTDREEGGCLRLCHQDFTMYPRRGGLFNLA